MPRAWCCRRLGPGAIQIEDRPALRVEGAGDVVVDVLTCGVDFVQTLMVEGLYQVKPPVPFVPGHEVTGVVKEVGTGVKSVRPGDVVMLNMPGAGGMTEQVRLQERMVIPLPEGCDVLRAPGLLSYCTALFALRDRAHVRRGERVLVLGAAGTVGTAAVEVAKVLGAQVVAAASSDAKLALCRELGADHVVNYSGMTPDQFRAALKGVLGKKGCDVVYDPVGGELAQPSARALAYGGRYVVIGFASGGADAVSAIPRIPANLFLLKNGALLGSGLREWQVKDRKGAAKMNAEILQLWRDGKLRPPAAVPYSFDRLPDAYADLRGRRVVGRAVLTTPLLDARRSGVQKGGGAAKL